MSVTTDKRFLKSKYAIEQAVETLYDEGRSISSMTVSEITSLAKVARKTFYLHYVDLNDFLLQFCDEQINKFKETCIEDSDNFYLAIAKSFINLTRTIADNSLVKMLILSHQYSGVFLTKLHNIVKEYMQNHPNSPVKDEYEIEFFASGIVSTFQYWIKQKNYPSDSPLIEEDIMVICNRILLLLTQEI